ncbi:hypothetical protein EFQ99_00045 [Rhizobium vallis]|uniref:Uncharacterized protein n=1 Tax=Rhizobium vallis TaxID=634290 RepID=A0A432PQ81_9HYPH|nr:hypothetical protein [Rhizobium vallis]RUM26642.1 hypothetical protein EFQ99_00045 [Rhizobium vallis]
MEPIKVIRKIAEAIDKSVEETSDVPWKNAVEAGGLISMGDTGTIGIDECFQRSFGPLLLQFQYKWWDTTKTFSPGPDRTRLTLTLLHGSQEISKYSGTYDT